MKPSRALLVPLLLATLAVPVEAAQTRAYMTTTDFGTGGLSWIDLATRTVHTDVAPVFRDAVLRCFGGLVYVVNREGQDNIQVIDPAAGHATIRNFSVGNGLNPQDIAFVSATKAYVSRYDSPDLLVVNPSSPSGGPMSVIPLGAFADADGSPEMSRMVRVGHYVFVACQRLTSFQPSNPSFVVVVDTRADTVVDVDPVAAGKQAIVLAARNPSTTFAYDPQSGRLLLGCSGAFGVNDGGVEAIDPIALSSLGLMVTEAELGGDVTGVAWWRPDHAYAIVGFETAVVSWNPATGLRKATVYQPGGFSLADVEVSQAGEVYVANNGFASPGVYVFRAGPDTLLAGPLGTGLPPFDLVFDETLALAVDGALPGLSLSAPWPNPARVGAVFSLRLARAAELRAEIFDASGRRVRRLLEEARTMGEHRIAWDLRDDAGTRVASGIYLARFTVDGTSVTRRIAAMR